MTLGFHLLSVEASGYGRRQEFCFDPKAAALAQRFYQGAEVQARAFAHALRDLKALLVSRLG
jgi:hypothetical protein